MTHTPDRDGSRDFDFQTGDWRDGLEPPVVGSFANGVGVDGKTWEKNRVMTMTRVE